MEGVSLCGLTFWLHLLRSCSFSPVLLLSSSVHLQLPQDILRHLSFSLEFKLQPLSLSFRSTLRAHTRRRSLPPPCTCHRARIALD